MILCLPCRTFLYAQAQQSAPNDPVYPVSAGITTPKLTHQVDPVYTWQAWKDCRAGTVRLAATVGKTGIPRDLKVVKGIDSGLDRNAMSALEKWRFDPGIKDGEPVSVRVAVEVNYRLGPPTGRPEKRACDTEGTGSQK